MKPFCGKEWNRTIIKWLTATRNNLYTTFPNFYFILHTKSSKTYLLTMRFISDNGLRCYDSLVSDWFDAGGGLEPPRLSQGLVLEIRFELITFLKLQNDLLQFTLLNETPQIPTSDIPHCYIFDLWSQWDLNSRPQH